MLYVQDRMNKTLAVIDNYYNDEHTMILESGVSTYNFSISKNQEGAEYLIRGNYIVLTDEKGIGWKFTIMATDETHGTLDVECEDLGLELLNKVRNSWASPGTAQPFKYYFDKALRDTGWTLGINEISGLSRTLQWDGRDTALKRLLSICTQFDHAEIEFKIEFRNMAVVKQVVNVYKKRGVERSDVQLVYGDTVNDIRKTTAIYDFRTALEGVGGVIQQDNPVEGAPEEHVDFSALSYDDGEYFTTVGDPFLYARTANQQFNIKGTYAEDFYEYDTQDPQELLNRTLTRLKELSQPALNYEVDVVKVNSSLNLGDTVTIIDHDYKPELLLSGRVLQLKKSYTDPSKNQAVFGNFLILYSNISDQLRQLQEDLKAIKPNTTYMWLRYAKDDQGNGMSATPTADTKYFAMLVNKKTGVPSDNPADYKGHWKLMQGSDGKDGIPGAKGDDGKTSYTHFAYANNVSGTKDFSVDDPTGRSYMGVYTNFEKADPTDPSLYRWSLTKGETGEQGMQGAQGPQGDIGIPGKPGADGKTSYTHVAYADNDKGGGFSQSPANKAYMGWYTDFTANDSTNPSDYAWSLIKGKDGSNGAPGKPGSDGKTPYFHTAWADSKDGKINFSLTDSTNRGYLGNYTDFTQADSTDPAKYRWTELVGNLNLNGRNLAARKLFRPWKQTSFKGDSSVITLTETTPEPYSGLNIQRPSTFKNNTEYIMSFDFKILTGEITAIGGHMGDFSQTEYIKIDGVDKGKHWEEANAFAPLVGRSFHFEIGMTTLSDYSGNAFGGFFIQPNRGSTAHPYTAEISNLRINQGNKDMGWQVPPEDTQQQIDTINKGLADTNSEIAAVTKVDVRATAPTSPKKGDQWWVKEANGEINAFKIWDGTKWAPSTITQSLLAIKELDAVNINGSVINGSKFTNSFDFKGIDGIHFQGVTTIADGAVDSTWKIPENSQTGYSKMSASGFESVVRNTAGTIIKQARLGMGELFLFGDNVSGWINEQDSYRNSGVPSYLNNWGVWNQATQVRIIRNGRQVTISGYIKHYGGTVSPILKVPAWAIPGNQEEIINGASFDNDVGNSKACNLALGKDALLANNAGVQVNGYLSFSASYTGVDIK